MNEAVNEIRSTGVERKTLLGDDPAVAHANLLRAINKRISGENLSKASAIDLGESSHALLARMKKVVR
ncbi:hypothetical protein [Rhodanobacter sp. FW106-PBR-LB-2-11]|uniref:hypothetical protein n=1 Tax=Rhodanobacter sp. FW106-PBR-LB-2-11 TaxID=1524463 RepID=UPI0034E59C01